MINGHPRMLGLTEHVHQLGNANRVLHCDDVGARYLHVLDGECAELEDAAEHAPLLRAQGVALATGERVLDQLAEVRLLAEAEGLKQALEPRSLFVRPRLLRRKIVLEARGIAHSETSAGVASCSAYRSAIPSPARAVRSTDSLHPA